MPSRIARSLGKTSFQALRFAIANICRCAFCPKRSHCTVVTSSAGRVLGLGDDFVALACPMRSGSARGDLDVLDAGRAS